MRLLQSLRQIVFPANIDEAFSERAREEAALRVAARLSRGNVNVQEKRVTTDRDFNEQMSAYDEKVSQKAFVFQD